MKKGLSDFQEAHNGSVELICKLTSPELQQRKSTILKSLKDQTLQKMEISNGFALRFPGDDYMIHELTDFVLTERECCDFLIYNLSVSGDKKESWLTLKGPEGSKEFIKNELGLV